MPELFLGPTAHCEGTSADLEGILGVGRPGFWFDSASDSEPYEKVT